MAIVVLPTLEESPKYYVYALLCEDSGRAGYVKFGMSKNITARLSSLRTSSPIPVRYIATVDTGYLREKARTVERALHIAFRDRNVRGEWFSFDFQSAEDKADFNDGCKRVFATHFYAPDIPWWSKISVEALDEYNKERRRQFIMSKHRKKIEAKARYKVRQRQAWKELG